MWAWRSRCTSWIKSSPTLIIAGFARADFHKAGAASSPPPLARLSFHQAGNSETYKERCIPPLGKTAQAGYTHNNR
jgi:hypothetical protein